MENVGEKIYNLRKEKGVSQEELGFALNVSRQTVSRWERDTVKPTVENLESLTKFFGVNSNYFLSEELAAAEQPEESAAPVESVKKRHNLKILKIVFIVVGMVVLALCLIACGIAAYVNIAPVKGQYVMTSESFDYAGIIFLVLGTIIASIFITLIVLLIIKGIKNSKKSKM